MDISSFIECDETGGFVRQVALAEAWVHELHHRLPGEAVDALERIEVIDGRRYRYARPGEPGWVE